MSLQNEVISRSLSAPDARRLTDEVKADAAALWAKLLQLYEGGAHTALGYSSWGAYYEAEFGHSKQQGHRILDAARVADALQSPMGDSPSVTERVARELAPLRDEPERLRETYGKVIELHGAAPTAAQVREVVRGDRQEVVPHEDREVDRPPPSKRQQIREKAHVRRVDNAITRLGAMATGLAGTDLQYALSGADEEMLDYWHSTLRDAAHAVNDLRRRFAS